MRVIEEHYDQPTKREDLEVRRRHHLDRLGLDEDTSDDEDTADDGGGDSE